MHTTTPAALLTIISITGAARAELIAFENTNPEFGVMKLYDPNYGDLIYGQALDLTHGAFDQPQDGLTPRGSIFFMHVVDQAGDFVWMGTGTLTRTARSVIGTPIPDPYANMEIDFFGPQLFEQGDTVGSISNFIDGWRPIHGVNDLTGLPGIFTVGEEFTVGVEFELGDGTHYGYATFERDFEVRHGQVGVQITPLRWGYESVAGVGVSVVPAPGVLSLTGVCVLGAGLRRRCW